jgi:hypothetical protein
MKIAFHIDQLCLRGTSVALYDYARYNEELLGNKSVIVVPKKGMEKSNFYSIEKFSSRFDIVLYEIDIDTVLEDIDVLYCIKYGKNDGVYSKKVKTIVHCVFDLSEPHGDLYIAVSSSLAKKYNQKLFLPHMISLPPSLTKENMRTKLNIPANAIVFGRYGGEDTFNIEFCWDVIRKIVNERTDVYFLFSNTPKIAEHSQIIYVPPITNIIDKNRFVCTCDAHLECGTLGHSFGLAIGEFSVNNKPIIAYKSDTLWNTSHLDILKEKGLYFTDRNSFYDLLMQFNPKEWLNKDLNCYKEYSPEKVMKIFQSFL